MSTNVVNPPFPRFDGLDGQPLENGIVWVGVANMDAPSNPIAVFWDSALTVSAAQPIRTVNGYLSRDGSPGVLFAGSDYSIKVTTAVGVPVYSAPARVDTAVTDVVISSGESLIVESGGTVDLEDGSVLNIGDGGGVGVDVVMAANARIVGEFIPDTDGSQQLGLTTRRWFLNASGVRVEGDVLPQTAGGMNLGGDAFPAEETVSRTMRANSLTTYRTAQPASSSDYAGLAKLNARDTLLAAGKQSSTTITAVLGSDAYNTSGVVRTAPGIYEVTIGTPIDPNKVRVFVTPYSSVGTAEYGVSWTSSTILQVRFLGTGIVDPGLIFDFEVRGAPSLTGASGIVSPIA